jgi:hypothetical protein
MIPVAQMTAADHDGNDKTSMAQGVETELRNGMRRDWPLGSRAESTVILYQAKVVNSIVVHRDLKK